MYKLPTTSVAHRLNALAAAVVVTLAVMAGIDSLASREAATPQWAQAPAVQSA